MTRDERNEQGRDELLRRLRGGLDFLPGSSEDAAALVISMHLAALTIVRQEHHIDGEEHAQEILTLYRAVEAVHPGKWGTLGGPRLPNTMNA